MYKLLIAGSRNFNDYGYLKKRIDKLIANWKKEEIIIISGGAKGTDTLAEKYAIENDLSFEVYPAEWEKLGKKAGMVRNIKMAESATHAAIFWDGKSPGTKHMIEISEENSVRTVIFKVKVDE